MLGWPQARLQPAADLVVASNRIDQRNHRLDQQQPGIVCRDPGAPLAAVEVRRAGALEVGELICQLEPHLAQGEDARRAAHGLPPCRPIQRCIRNTATTPI
jgi:hypothetical protein